MLRLEPQVVAVLNNKNTPADSGTEIIFSECHTKLLPTQSKVLPQNTGMSNKIPTNKDSPAHAGTEVLLSEHRNRGASLGRAERAVVISACCCGLALRQLSLREGTEGFQGPLPGVSISNLDKEPL